jgi:hypothetical protein
MDGMMLVFSTFYVHCKVLETGGEWTVCTGFKAISILFRYSQICPNGHLPLTVVCVMRPLCFCPAAAHSLLKESVLNGHLSYTSTNFWSPGWLLKTDLTVFWICSPAFMSKWNHCMKKFFRPMRNFFLFWHHSMTLEIVAWWNQFCK